MKNINIKLLKLQKKIQPIVKDSTNPFFNSKYFDINKLLEVLRPMLNEEGLLITQPLGYNLGVSNGITYVSTVITDTESDECVQSTGIIPIGLEAQKMGSAITYLRRYTLQSLLALQAEDDDGNSAKPSVKTGYKPSAKSKDVGKEDAEQDAE